MKQTWESNIIIEGRKNDFEVLPFVKKFISQEHFIEVEEEELSNNMPQYISQDTYPLPLTEDREGYYDQRHYDYWLSGIVEFAKIKNEVEKQGVVLDSNARILDFGCASGRVLRHFAIQSEVEAWGCDINADHVSWCNRFLPDNSIVFQNTSIPNLQIESNFFDLIYCLSVFTHIENFETSWLCELRRTLKPGGIAYVTVHDETSWNNMPKDWGVGYAVINHPDFDKGWLKTGFPDEKFVSRWNLERSYTSNVFYKQEYLKKVWGKFFKICDVIPMGSNYQTVMILQKK